MRGAPARRRRTSRGPALLRARASRCPPTLVQSADSASFADDRFHARDTADRAIGIAKKHSRGSTGICAAADDPVRPRGVVRDRACGGLRWPRPTGVLRRRHGSASSPTQASAAFLLLVSPGSKRQRAPALPRPPSFVEAELLCASEVTSKLVRRRVPTQTDADAARRRSPSPSRGSPPPAPAQPSPARYLMDASLITGTILPVDGGFTVA